MLAIAPQNAARFFCQRLMGTPAAHKTASNKRVSAFKERTDEGSLEFEKIADKRLAN